MKETKVVCPHCGKEIKIAEREHISIGIAIGKNSGLGTVVLPPADDNKPKSKAQLRIEAMKAIGIDTTGFFAMRGADGKEDKIASIVDGCIQEVDINDPIVNKIMSAGSLRNAHLFKQHVMAQMLHMLTRRTYDFRLREYVFDTNWHGKVTLDHFVMHFGCKGYDYCWKVLNDMLMRQSAMFRHKDTKCFKEDNLWYNRLLAVRMLEDYINQLSKIMDAKNVRKYKGKEYIRIKGAEKILPKKKSAYGYLFVSEKDTLMRELRKYLHTLTLEQDPIVLHHVVEKLYSVLPQLRLTDLRDGENVSIEVSKDFINAYKGYGAFFTMQNMILFHNCVVYLPGKHAGDTTKLNKTQSLAQLNKWAEEYKGEGYKMLGALKQFIRDNNFDIEAKMKEWENSRR